MKILKILSIAILIPMLSACRGDDSPTNSARMDIRSESNTLLVTDITTSETYKCSGADYAIFVDFDNATGNVSINNLLLPGASRAISFDLPETRLQVTMLGFKIEQIQPVSVPTNTGSSVNISDLKVEYYYPANATPNPLNISFTINGSMRCVTLFEVTRYQGTTSSTDLDDPADSPYSTTISQYMVRLDSEDNTVSIAISRPKFVDAMPDQMIGTMIFPDIPVTYTEDGITFESASFVPMVGEDPYPQFRITNLSGRIVAGSSFDLTFDCQAFKRNVKVAATCF